MCADIRAGAVRAVVGYDLDRLRREPLEAENFYLLAEVEPAGRGGRATIEERVPPGNFRWRA